MKNNGVTDIKPENATVTDIKSGNKSVFDIKSNTSQISMEETIILEDKTIRVGEPMGLLLSLTYPTTVNFQGVRI